MSINFPTSLDNFPNPVGTDLLENATTALDHDVQHSNANDAIEALEAKVGIDGSAVTTSHSYKLSEIISTDKAVGKTAVQTLTNKTLTAPQLNFGSDGTGDIYYRSATGVTTRLAAGALATILSISSGGIPSWIPNPAASDGSTTVKGVFEEATQAEVIAGTATGATGARLAMNPSSFIAALPTLLQGSALVKFGGTGADGALVISSGTTTIDLAGAAYVTKNYSSISITGTGVLAFINPASGGTIVHLKSQGQVVLTSSATPMIDCSGLGGDAGTGTIDDDGTSGVAATDIFGGDSSNGKLGLKRSASLPANGGVVYTIKPMYTLNSNRLNIRRSIFLTAGSGGGAGGGGASGSTGGAGGRGGGGLIIECAGALNFTTALGISVAGKAGSNGVTSGTDSGAGGGGGGSAGFCVILYNTLTAASGTVNVTGGAGGNGSLGVGALNAGGQGGGGGGMYAGAGGRGGAGGTGGGASGAGTAGTNSTTTGAGGGAAGTGGAGGAHDDGGGGGGGCAGEYFIAPNLIFA